MRRMSAGHAVVDSLVALMILSLASILSFRAVLQADRVATFARETRVAQTLLDDLMRTAPRSFVDAGGEARGFNWTVETRRTGAERPIEVCRRRVVVVNGESGRRYWAATLETCPASEAVS